MAKSKQEILQFYEELSKTPGWTAYEGMYAFLRSLFDVRELNGCVFFTSHQILCITRQPKYPEWFDGPLLSLDCRGKDRMHFEMTITTESTPVRRGLTESANCPMNVALQEFDNMYAKWDAAHESCSP